MKSIFFVLLIVIQPLILFAQSKADYEHAIKRFVNFYNNKQADSIVNMWPEQERKEVKSMWSKERTEALLKEYGRITSYKYLGTDDEDPDKVVVYTTQFSIASSKTTSLTLDKEDYLGTFRFITSSEGIDKLLKKRK